MREQPCAVKVYRKNNQGPEKTIDNVYVIAEHPVSNGAKLWIGLENLGLYLFEKRTETMQKIYKNISNTDSLISPWVYALLPEQDDAVWVGTRDGVDIVRLDRDGNPRFKHFLHDANNPKSYSGSRVNAFLKDSKNMLWIATQGGGVNMIDLNNPETTFVYYDMDEKNPASISSNQVKCILEDINGSLWFGTDGGGLNQFNREMQTFQHFTVKDGLPNNVIYGMLEDNDGNFWLSTNNGLSKFNSSTHLFKNYSVEDGLQSNEFNTGSYFKSKRGEMFFGGINGLNAFFPDSIEQSFYIPPVVLTGFKLFNTSLSPGDSVDGRVILQKHISETNEIELSYSDNVFTIEFASLDFSSPQQNLYAYILEGFDKTWISTTSDQRSVTYTNLDAGEYVFRVIGSNSDGVWNKDGAMLRIIITPPFWKLWWFISLSFFTLFGATFWIVITRYDRLKRAQDERERFSERLLESQESERKRISHDLHDSIGQDLLVVKNSAVYGSQLAEKHPEVKAQFEFISEVVSDSVQKVRQISYNLHPYQLDKLGLTEAMKTMIHTIEEATPSITYTVELADVNNLLQKEQEINLFRILQEMLNNVIKHSHANEVHITVRKFPETIHLIVTDNGKGFSVSQTLLHDESKSGIGLQGILERVRILKGVHFIVSAPGGGTKFTVLIPFQNLVKQL
ncbi:MAG: hypothetical protein HYZ34_08875 [Ignavibacteriae bacterium]|nr:hypothetical protein [Ignavibacteriota bacterium]